MKKLILTLGCLTLTATTQAQNTHYFQDTERKLFTINAALLPSMEKMAQENTFANYFDGVSLPADASTSDMKTMMSKIADEGIDMSKYLKSAIATCPENERYCYRLTGFTIEKLSGMDMSQRPIDFPTSGTPLTYLGIEMRYGATYGSICSKVYKNLSGPRYTVSDLSSCSMIIPREGVTLNIKAIQLKDKSGSTADMTNINGMGQYLINFVPNTSGSSTIEQDNVKATFTYERCDLPLATIHDGMARTIDFYKNNFHRDSYDGKGAPVYNLVYYPTGNSDLAVQFTQKDKGIDDIFNAASRRASEDDYGDETPNFLITNSQIGAFAESTYNPFMMLFGMGGYNQADGVYISPATEQTIMCHEFTHLITRQTAKLSSSNSEGGALNESFSDIMAISMVKINEGRSDWYIGGNGFVVGKSNLRDMKNPKNSLEGLFPCADTYQGEHWDAEDKYAKCGVQNKFYYLLTDGGTGTNDKGYTYNVTGIGIEKASQIAYLTLTKYVHSETDFSTIRERWIQAASEKYGANGAEVEAVGKAWDGVGVYKDGITPTGIDVVKQATPRDNAWYTLDGRRISGEPTGHGIYFHQGKKIIR